MIKLSFVGDIMLGRFVADKYREKSYKLFSDSVLSRLNDSDYRIANLESPVVTCESTESLRFAADPILLHEVKWVDCLSLSNNHINDFGTKGMEETIRHLKEAGIPSNGLYTDKYEPIIIDKNGERVAIITCADMMNYEFSDDCPYKTLRMNNPAPIYSLIADFKNQGYFVILYLHAGMLFSRFLNPLVRDFAHAAIDNGANAIVTAHSHCLGGYEMYKGALIINSLGDFLMDGSSYRRRESCVLELNIENSQIVTYEILPTCTSLELVTDFAINEKSKKMLENVKYAADKIERKSAKYTSFFKKQYKIEMLQHSLSTISFEYNRRGLTGFLKILWIRIGDVFGMIKRMLTDRSKMSYDSDAVKSVSNKSIK